MTIVLVQVLLEGVSVPLFCCPKKGAHELELRGVVGFEAGHRDEVVSDVALWTLREV